MTISEPTIAEAVARYQREYDRYLKLCSRVADICRYEVVEANAIRAHVTFRAKGHKSLETKLRKFAQIGKKTMPTVSSVFEQVRDLAAVRVATYVQTDERKVTDAIAKRFAGSNGSAVAIDLKDKHATNSQNFYRATHLEVFLPSQDLVGTYSNLIGVPCEIQVCSMMAHVWNEVEHDLGYNPTVGTLSGEERNFLTMLGQSVRIGDGTIGSLFAATERRQKEQGGAFTDVYDFVARLRGWFPGSDFGRNAGALFESFQPIRLLTPDSIRKLLDVDEPMTEHARATLDDARARLAARGDTRFELDRNSSDLLLVLLLPKIGKHLAAATGDAVAEGVVRVRWLAERFQELEAPVEAR